MLFCPWATFSFLSLPFWVVTSITSLAVPFSIWHILYSKRPVIPFPFQPRTIPSSVGNETRDRRALERSSHSMEHTLGPECDLPRQFSRQWTYTAFGQKVATLLEATTPARLLSAEKFPCWCNPALRHFNFQDFLEIQSYGSTIINRIPGQYSRVSGLVTVLRPNVQAKSMSNTENSCIRIQFEVPVGLAQFSNFALHLSFSPSGTCLPGSRGQVESTRNACRC